MLDNVSKKYAFIYKNDKKRTNKKELKNLHRLAQYNKLKSISPYPDLVEEEDIKSPDPILYNKLKHLYSTVPVSKRWRSKFLFPKNYKQKEYSIPSSIINTGLYLLRYNIHQMKSEQTDRERFLEKLFPKLGRTSVNPKLLYDAFNDSYRPSMFSYGEVFDFTWKTEQKRFSPGILTEELKNALNMTEFTPPPWIFKMQKIGLPPAYPDLKIPGVNAPIPLGCQYGYEPNKWGKPVFLHEKKDEYIYNLEHQYNAFTAEQKNEEVAKYSIEKGSSSNKHDEVEYNQYDGKVEYNMVSNKQDEVEYNQYDGKVEYNMVSNKHDEVEYNISNTKYNNMSNTKYNNMSDDTYNTTIDKIIDSVTTCTVDDVTFDNTVEDNSLQFTDTSKNMTGKNTNKSSSKKIRNKLRSKI